MTDTITATTYQVENDLGDGWEYMTMFGTQESAEEWLHRTGPFSDLPPVITIDNPRWRIIKVEVVERSTVVLNVETVRTA